MKNAMITRMASMVYDLVENCGVYGEDTEMTYEDACDALGLDDFEKIEVIAMIAEDLRIV